MKRFFACLSAVAVLAFAGNAMALSVTPNGSGTDLVNAILGGGIAASNITYTGAAAASGTFSGGIASGLGIDTGIILTSGSATNAIGPNDSGSITTINNLPGDANLNSLIGATTLDASVLEFDFTSAGGDLFFNYVFGSDEYNEWVGSAYNDVFGFFLDGVNIALIPGTSTPVAINTVNLGSNSGYYNDNPGGTGTQYDGFTDVFTATALGLSAGTHHIKLAIADTADYSWDSGVFIQAGSFSDQPTAAVPEPSTFLLLGSALTGLGLMKKKFRF